MLWQSNLYAVPLLVGAALLIFFELVAWRRDSTLSVMLFFVYALFCAGLMIAYALELLSADLQVILFWKKIQHIFISTPVIWLLFIIVYMGQRDWLTPRRLMALFFVPVCQMIAAWTNEYHGLYWTSVGTQQAAGGLTVFQRTYGVLFYVGIGYLYFITALSILVMVWTLIRSRATYHDQIGLLLAGVSLPALSNIPTLMGLTHALHFDFTPLGFALACLPIGLNLYRQNMFDVVPSAYRQVIHSMSDAVIVLNVENTLIDANPAAEALLQKPSAQIIGQPARAVFAAAPEFLKRYEDATESLDEVVFGMGRLQRYFDMRISGLYNRGGKLTGRVVVLRDVTERKQAEETIRQAAHELEERNDELNAFSHTVAHDLRAPLGIMMGYVSVLQHEDGLSPAAHKYLGSMEKAALRMDNMITGLLLLSRVRNISEVVTAVDMTQAAQAALERFHKQVEERSIHVEITPDMPRALGHDVWIEEAFANLIGNAVKYIGRDNPAPCITVRGLRQGEWIRYEVEDNGLGISEDDQQKLFEMFARFHRDEATGAGLGLSILLRIITRLKGEVGVESVLGAGSTFWFTLPAAGHNHQNS